MKEELRLDEANGLKERLFSLMFTLAACWLGRGIGICALGASTALIGASVYHSWVVDFQPQGRYLFPLLPILGILCGWFVHCFRQRIMFIGCITMYIMGLYSFIFDTLTKIPRIGW